MTGPVRYVGRLGLAATVAAMVASAAVVPVAAQVRVVATTGWPQFQGSPRHPGDDPAEKSVTRANVGQLRVAWTAALPSTSINSEVVVTGGAAYAGSGDGVTALNAATGASLWQATLPGAVLGTPSVQDGLVLVAISEGTARRHKGFVVALNATTGATVWMRSVGNLGVPSLASSTTVTTTGDRAYVTLASGQVEALGIKHGFKVWMSAVLPGCAVSQPSVAHGLVVVGGGGTDVSALHASDGTVAWHDALGPGCGESSANWLPAISQGTVYAGLLSGAAALNLASGAVVWQNTSVTGLFFPLSVTGNAVIVGPDGGDSLAALRRSDGSVLWQSALAGQVAGTATFGDLSWGIHQPGGNDQAVAFSRFTGHRVFASTPFSNTDTQGFPPTVVAGRVYVNLGDRVVCLALPASG